MPAHLKLTAARHRQPALANCRRAAGRVRMTSSGTVQPTRSATEATDGQPALLNRTKPDRGPIETPRTHQASESPMRKDPRLVAPQPAADVDA